jgi:hypothetical protein
VYVIRFGENCYSIDQQRRFKRENEKQLSVCKKTKSCIHASLHLFEWDTIFMAKKATGLRGR